MSNVTALFDACVLYPATLRDFLMCLAETNLIRARWTDRIHDEWIDNLLADRTDLTRDRLNRTRQLMDRAVPDCLITGYEDLIESITLLDADDRHVLAAAIRGRVDVIVTLNLKDFPKDELTKYGIEAHHPDAFADRLYNVNAAAVCSAAKRHRGSLRKPAKTGLEYLDALSKVGLSRTASALAGYIDLI